MPERTPSGVHVGICEGLIHVVVAAFYAKVRADGLLGPLFESKIADWDTHLEKLRRFWSAILLMTGRYKGTPMQAHLDLPEIDAAHFTRWLALFDEALSETCTPDQAGLFRARAHRIAESFRIAIEIRNGVGPMPPVSVSTLESAP